MIALATLASFVTSLSFRTVSESQKFHLILASAMWACYTGMQLMRLSFKAHFGDRLANSVSTFTFLVFISSYWTVIFGF